MAPEPAKRRVGFIGLGLMGKPILTNIIRGGHSVVVWNRTREKCQEFVRQGAEEASSPKELVQRSDITICMLRMPTDTVAVVSGSEQYKGEAIVDGITKGKIVVDMSTNSPLVVRRLASLVESRGGEMMDAPVLGNPNIASKGALTILTSGKKEVVERVRPVLESVGTKFFYLGSVGSSAAMKLVLNLHILSVNAIFLETLSLATKLGVHPKAALNIWNSSIHKTYVSEQYGSKVIEGSFSTPLATIEVMQKDLSLAEQVAKEVNFPLLVGSAAGEIYTASAAKGWKDLDISALVKLYEDLNQIKVAGPYDEDGKEGEGKMHEGKA